MPRLAHSMEDPSKLSDTTFYCTPQYLTLTFQKPVWYFILLYSIFDLDSSKLSDTMFYYTPQYLTLNLPNCPILCFTILLNIWPWPFKTAQYYVLLYSSIFDLDPSKPVRHYVLLYSIIDLDPSKAVRYIVLLHFSLFGRFSVYIYP